MGKAFVDSGANDGMWSLMAASYGCAVYAIEPQLLCLRWLAASAHRNQLAINAYNNLLSTDNFSSEVRTDECAGTSQFLLGGAVGDAFNRDRAIEDTWKKKRVAAISLDELISDPKAVIGLWHIDTEGAEPVVLRSAMKLFAEGRIERIIMEWEPTRWHKFGVTSAQATALAHDIFKGWNCSRLCSPVPMDFRRHTVVMWQQDVYCVKPGVQSLLSDREMKDTCSKQRFGHYSASKNISEFFSADCNGDFCGRK